jgi:hypothetical protein
MRELAQTEWFYAPPKLYNDTIRSFPVHLGALQIDLCQLAILQVKDVPQNLRIGVDQRRVPEERDVFSDTGFNPARWKLASVALEISGMEDLLLRFVSAKRHLIDFLNVARRATA